MKNRDINPSSTLANSGSRAEPDFTRLSVYTDAAKRKDARKTLCQHIDNVISACYGPGLSITHKCIDGDGNEQLKVDIPKKSVQGEGSFCFPLCKAQRIV
jgi:hypothetical protein